MSEPAPALDPTKVVVAEAVASASHNERTPYRDRLGAGPSTSQGHQYASVTLDLLLVCANCLITFSLKFFSGGHLAVNVPAAHYFGFLVLYSALVIVFCQNQGLYQAWRSVGPLDESFSVLKAVVLASLILAGFIYLSGDNAISRSVVGFSALLNTVTLPVRHFWKREIVKHHVESGKDGRHVLIIGAGDVGLALARHLEENKHLGYVVKGFIDSGGKGRPGVIGDVSELSRLARLHFVDEIFVTKPSERELVGEVVLQAREHHLDVKVVPELFDGLGWRAPIRYIGDFPVMELLREPIPAFGLFVKRLIDLFVSAMALITLAPIMALIALAIRLDSRGPAIYSSWRVGAKGRKFLCYKFRTMVVNADDLKDGLRHMNERKGPFFKIAKDPRLTRIGGFLRRYSLDELPQFWNVFTGEMSLVGPRPPMPEECAEYTPECLRRLDVKPGITGLWQVYGRREPSFDRVLELDLEYIETWSLWLDAKILLKTLPAAVSGSGS